MYTVWACSTGLRDNEGYWSKNVTLIERLGITEEEEKHLKNIIGVDEKYHRNNERRKEERRNEEGLTPKQVKLKALREEVWRLRKEGLVMSKIADKLGISKAKVVRLNKEK